MSAMWKSVRITLIVMVLMLLPALGLSQPGTVEDQAGKEADVSGATPLAGEPGRQAVFGAEVEIPSQDRSRISALTVGASVFTPPQGTASALPLAAFYLRRASDSSRTRGIVALVMNELEYDRYLPPFELVADFASYTLPFGQTVVIRGDEIRPTSAVWGSVLGGLGAGIRIPVHPFQVDNDLRIQLLGRGGYFFSRKTGATGPEQMLPPDTLLYGLRLRGRYDAMRRNILELPHQGIAAGFDLDYTHRDRWRAVVPNGSNNGSYWQISGYLSEAMRIPGLSDRNRLLMAVYGGATGAGRGDRFNAFRINGSPLPGEADELAHPRFQAAVFNDALASDYALASVAYRRQLLFFLYLTLEGSYILSQRATVAEGNQVVFRRNDAFAGTVGVDSAFLWKSAVSLAYSWDSGFIRGGRSGSGIIVTWNVAF